MLVINKTSWLTRNKPQGYMGNVFGYSHKRTQADTNLFTFTYNGLRYRNLLLAAHHGAARALVATVAFLKGGFGSGGHFPTGGCGRG